MNPREYCGLVGNGQERKTKRDEGKGKYAAAIERNSKRIEYNENRQRVLLENKGVCPYRYQDIPMFSASSRTLKQLWDEEDRIREEHEARKKLEFEKTNAKVHREEEQEEEEEESATESESEQPEPPPAKKAKISEEEEDEGGEVEEEQ